MRITELRLHLVTPRDNQERLLAYLSVTFDDCFVIREAKIVRGNRRPFVAMPSKEITDHCLNASCHAKNSVKAHFCRKCGQRHSVKIGSNVMRRERQSPTSKSRTL